MIDRNVEFPNRFRMTLVPGTDDIYEVVPAPGDVVAEGDTFSKANMLPDAIPALLGLKMANPQVKDALNVLANIGNVHVWQRVQSGVTDYLTSTDPNAYPKQSAEGGQDAYTYLGQLGDKARIEVVSYVGTGTYGSSNPCSITASFPIKVAFMLSAFRAGNSYSYYVMVSDDLSTSFEKYKGFMINDNSYDNSHGYSFGKRSDDGKTFQW